MKKLLLLLIIVSNIAFAGGRTFTRCYHNGELYFVNGQQGNTPAAICPTYVESNNHKHEVNASQTDFKTIDNPDHCTFDKTKTFEDLTS